MERKMNRFPVIMIILLYLSPVIFSCTTFCYQYRGDWIFGRNYDWDIEYGMVVVNKRGVAKTAMTDQNPARWVSRYGSITFNQYGRELPLGGMNEAGLVIECMWLQYTEYPPTDSRPQMRELQWIQYQLDNHATVDEVIAGDKKVKIAVRNSHPLHFLVCDRQKRCAVIEFLGGHMKAYTQSSLPVSALTNNTYENSINTYKLVNGNEESPAFRDAGNSLRRFIRAGLGVKNWQPGATSSAIDHAFNILEKVTVKRTMFSIVYDVKKGLIYFKTKSNPDRRFINIGKFDFSCDTPVKILDMASKIKGDVTGQFVDYTFEANLDLVKKSWMGTDFLKNTPAGQIQQTARYPEMLKCVQQTEPGED